jgi:hypothetical protein
MGCTSCSRSFNPGKVGFAKGTYTIEVEGDGKKGQCETKLPLPACTKDGAVKAGLNTRCSGDLPLVLEQPPCSEPKTPHTVGVLKIAEAPKDLKIKLINNKKPYGDATITPKQQREPPQRSRVRAGLQARQRGDVYREVRRVKRLAAIGALFALGCSGGQADVDNAETSAESLASADAAATSEPSAVVSAGSRAAPSSTGVNAIEKLGKICTPDRLPRPACLAGPRCEASRAPTDLVDADGKKGSCSLEVVKEMKGQGCVGDADVKLGLPGSVPVRGPEGGFSLVFGSAPASVKVSVTSAAKKKVAEQAFTPTYKTLQPNGPDCSPTCKQAQETLLLK